MLWSRPFRAQPPIVDVVKWTLAAARMAGAAVSGIQSLAAGIRQSAAEPLELGSFVVAALSPSFVVSVDPPDAEPSASPDVEDPFELDEALAERRSFFAQPEPLKWMAGGANALRIVPSLPHDGQNWGAGSLRPRSSSVRWSHAEQRNS